MRKYIAKDEEELIKQLEGDPELDKELEREKLVKGHVVEIRDTGKVHKKQVRQGKNQLHRICDSLLIRDFISSQNLLNSKSISNPKLLTSQLKSNYPKRSKLLPDAGVYLQTLF